MDAIIIPKEQAPKYRRILLNWHIGIDPIELEDGTFFISKKCYNMIPEGFDISEDEIKLDLREELSKFAVRKILPAEFKLADIEIVEKQIIK